MKQPIIIFFLFWNAYALAQVVTEKHYNTGEIAVRETVQEVYRNYGSIINEEKVEVFNKKGEIVYTGSRRNFAGHSSVYLTFHENGGVKTIKASSAPDAGIQWYRSEYQLDEDGNVISKREDSHDNRVTIPNLRDPQFPERKPLEEIKKQQPNPPKENQCASPMQTLTFLTNKTKKRIEILLVEKNDSNRTTAISLKPNQSIQLGEYINAEVFREPHTLYELKLKTGRNVYEAIHFKQLAVLIDESPQVKSYHFYWINN